MPSRILIHVDGATYTQAVDPANKVRDLQNAVNYLLTLIDKEEEAKHG